MADDAYRDDDPLRRLAAILAPRSDVVAPRERDLLIAIVDRFQRENPAGDVAEALRRAIGAALATRVSEAIGTAVADEVLAERQLRPEPPRPEPPPPSVFAADAESPQPLPSPEPEPALADGCEPVVAEALPAGGWPRVQLALRDRLGLEPAGDAGEARGDHGVVYRWSYAADTESLSVACVAKPLLMPAAALDRLIGDAIAAGRSGA